MPLDPTLPVFLWDPDARVLLTFATVEDATRHLRPWQEVGMVPAYDAEGRRLTFAVARRGGLLARFFPSAAEMVVLSAVETEPDGAEELRSALETRLGLRGAAGERRPLAELVALGVKTEKR